MRGFGKRESCAPANLAFGRDWRGASVFIPERGLPMIAMEQEIWEGDTLRFRMCALGHCGGEHRSAGGGSAHRSVIALAPGEGGETPSSNIAQGSDTAPGEEIERSQDGELRPIGVKGQVDSASHSWPAHFRRKIRQVVSALLAR